jgi:long-chain acyl-CoA synthetase
MAASELNEAYLQAFGNPPPPGKPHAVAVPGTERPNRSAIYRHWRLRDKPLITTIDPEIQTLHDFFEASIKKYGKRRCFGIRPWNPATRNWEDKYVWTSYAEVGERRKNFGAGLVEIHAGIKGPNDKYAVGVWSQNRPEWHIADLAATSQGLFSVSLYETLGPDSTEYIVNHAELSCVVCSLPHIPTLLKLAPRLPNLKIIISMDPLENGEPEGHSKVAVLNQFAAQHGIKIMTMAEVEETGARSGRGMRPPTADDVCTINYTSGTTGAPKGVVLTHRNGVAAVTCGRANGFGTPNDVHISYLPLAHIFGRMVDGVAMASGACIGFFRGDVLGLVDDMKILKPTGFISVPRLFNRFNSAIKTATLDAPGFRGTLSKRVIETKKASMKLPPGQAHNRHFLYDRIWTPKVKAAVGLNRAHTMVSGSAQLDPDVQEFLGAAFAVNFLQGFGMTETYACGTAQLKDDFSTGNIGPPGMALEVCLESVPEFDYTVQDKPYPRGELLVRGPVIFKGYHKNEEETKKTLEADGWFHTGDIVEVDNLGRIKIIDRKKNVLKLAQGEYISPERIENAYLANTALLASAFVHGDPKKSNLVAIFGVDPEQFAPFASQLLKETVSKDNISAIKAAAQNPKVKQEVLKILEKIGRKQKFNSYEKVKNCYLTFEPFSIENDLMTPT